jgi:hypothetical protein
MSQEFEITAVPGQVLGSRGAGATLSDTDKTRPPNQT